MSELDFDRWCLGQIKFGNASIDALKQRLIETFPLAAKGHVLQTAILIDSIARSVDLPNDVRATAIYAYTANELFELKQSLSLLFAMFAREDIASESLEGCSADLFDCLDSHKETMIFARLIDLAMKMRTKSHSNEEEIACCFQKLRQGNFLVPFVIEEGDSSRTRVLEIQAKVNVDQKTVTSIIRSNDFEILEDFRSGNDVSTLARNERRKLFNAIFDSIFAKLERLDRSDRVAYFEQQRADLELLAARMMKCDSLSEVFEGQIHLAKLMKLGERRQSGDPTIPLSELGEINVALTHFRALPQFQAGRRTVNLFSILQSIKKSANNWEERLIERVDVHP